MSDAVLLGIVSSAVALGAVVTYDEVRRAVAGRRKPDPLRNRSKVLLEGDRIVLRWRDFPRGESILFSELRSVHVKLAYAAFDPWYPDRHWILRDARREILVPADADDVPVLESLLRTLRGFDGKAYDAAENAEEGALVECWSRDKTTGGS